MRYRLIYIRYQVIIRYKLMGIVLVNIIIRFIVYIQVRNKGKYSLNKLKIIMEMVRMVLVRYWNLMYVLMYQINLIYQIITNMIKIITIFNIILI